MDRSGCVIAYLTSSYARASDTFIRDEVAQLRANGDDVLTFSIRKPSLSEVTDDDVANERSRTIYLLDLPQGRFVMAALRWLVRRPRRFIRAVSLARELARPGIRGRLWPVFYLMEGCVLAQYLEELGVEHLHNHIAEGSASVALLASQLTGIPFSFTVHGPSEWDRPAELSLDVKARNAAFVATISEFTRGQMRRWIAHDDWDKVHVVRCGVALEDAVPAGTPSSDEVTLVSVGRLVREKGHLVLLQSVDELHRQGQRLRLVLIGDGPERSKLQTYVNENGLQDVIELAGWQAGETVRSALRSADALVMPSFAEGLPISIMEAFSVGLPVISSEVGGVAELVHPGESGWLVAPGSVEELTQALQELLALSPQERRQMGKNGRGGVEVSHNIATQVQGLRALIHEAVGGASRRTQP